MGLFTLIIMILSHYRYRPVTDCSERYKALPTFSTLQTLLNVIESFFKNYMHVYLACKHACKTCLKNMNVNVQF